MEAHMIYTLTMNPSLDYIVDVEQFKLGLTNRTTKEQMFPGGKGFNVSLRSVMLAIDFINVLCQIGTATLLFMAC